MERIKLEEIVPYLAHGKLKCLYLHKTLCKSVVHNRLFMLDSIDQHGNWMYWTHDSEFLKPFNIIGKGFRASDFKPILRPLSDLTKEIEVNSEKFVPIIELAKIHDSKIEIEKIENQNETIVAYCKINYHPSIKKPLCRTFFEVDLEDLDFDYGFEVFGENEDDIIQTEFFPVKNQLKIFNKLPEWHFDIFNLIPRGLAVNINDLNELK